MDNQSVLVPWRHPRRVSPRIFMSAACTADNRSKYLHIRESDISILGQAKRKAITRFILQICRFVGDIGDIKDGKRHRCAADSAHWEILFIEFAPANVRSNFYERSQPSLRTFAACFGVHFHVRQHLSEVEHNRTDPPTVGTSIYLILMSNSRYIYNAKYLA